MTDGQRINEFRTRKGMTQDELGKKVGASRQYVCQIEKKDNLSQQIFIKFGAALGVHPAVLAGWVTEEQGKELEMDKKVTEAYRNADEKTKEIVRRILGV